MRTVALLSCFVSLALAETKLYRLQPDPDSRMELLVAKTGFLKGKQHRFLFERYEGTLRYDAGNPSMSHVTLTIDSQSISCKDTWVSAKDLKKIQDLALNEMLDAGRNPAMSFTSTSIRQISADKFEVTGDLTIRTITKPVVVSVTLSSASAGNLQVNGSAEIKMTDYKLKPPSAALGTIGTKDEMAFSFSLKTAR